MSTGSSIEWTDATWNPVAGCTPVSPGCLNCYAAVMANRLEGMEQRKYVGLTVLHNGRRTFNGNITLDGDALAAPLKWKKPRRVFVNSMSDLFHEGVPIEYIDRVFAVMASTPRHTYQILTKRPERMAEYLTRHNGARYQLGVLKAAHLIDGQQGISGGWSYPLPNVWLGTSVEDQKNADERIPHLEACPAAVRFLSAEPLLGPINLTGERLPHSIEEANRHGDGVPTFPDIDWVIVGGESGPRARPMHPDWARGLRDQCQAAGVAFFFKQWGAFEPVTPLYEGRDDSAENGRGDLDLVDTRGVIWNERDGQPNDMRTWQMERVGKKAAGRLLDGREWSEFPAALTAVA